MDIKKIISLTEARKNIFKIIEDVEKKGAYYTLTERGRAKAVIMPADDFESWQETLEVTKDFPDLDKSIKQAKEDLKKKNIITLDVVLANQGYVLADKAKEKYEYNTKPKSSKKTSKIRRRKKS